MRWLLLCFLMISIRPLMTSKPVMTWPVSVLVLRSLSRNSSNECAQDSLQLLESLENATYWAVRMADSSGHLPSGLLSGNTYSLGDFDGCTENINAHYCLLTLRMLGTSDTKITARTVHSAETPPSAYSHAWKYMQRAGERWRALRDEAHVGLCLPSTCTADQTRQAAHKALGNTYSSLDVTVNASEAMCTSKAHLRESFSTGEILFCSVFCGILCIVLIGTIAEFISKNRVSALRCFSLQRQLTSLIGGRAERGGNVLLDVLRVLSVMLIIMSHKMEFTMLGPLRNPQFVETMYTKAQLMPALNPSLVVDTFFFLGGLALSGKLLASTQSPLWSLYLQRYIRLTPPYMLVVFMYATMLPRIGSGPLWNAIADSESEYCRRNWWTNALYLNNYVKPEEMCLMHSWYLPCDFHLYVVCAPVVMLIAKRPRWGLTLLGVLGVVSVLAPFLTIFIKDTDPFLFVYFEFLRSDRQYPYFTDIYVKSHLRATPYLGGVLAGYLSRNITKRPLTKDRSAWLLIAGLIISSLTALSGAPFYMDPDGLLATSRWGRALYGAGHRAIWAMGLALIVVGATSLHSNAKKKRLVSARGIASSALRATFPLASLCYCAYLIHIVIITYEGATVRDPVYTDEILLGIRAFGDTVASFLGALGLYLTVEAPFRDLAKILLTSRNRIKQQINVDCVEESLKSNESKLQSLREPIFIAQL